jgi:hypothetical protein
MWLQESYSLRRSNIGCHGESRPVVYNSIRAIRSAVSQYQAWNTLVSQPASSYFDRRKCLICQPCRITDGLASTLFVGGMSARIGDETQPAVSVLDRHIRWMMTDLNDRYSSARTRSLRLELALGGLATLCFWLAWLCSSEGFRLAWQDINVIEPLDGPSLDLPPGCSAGLLRLAPKTKSARTFRADVAIAYETLSGYQFGLWFHRPNHEAGLVTEWRTTPTLVFCHPDNTPWTSFFFRQRFP